MESLSAEKLGALIIIRFGGFFIMLPTVQFNDEFGIEAGKICNVTPKRVLLSKFRFELLPSQDRPKALFRLCHLLA